jgi:signal transduction histidine kinase
MVMNHTPSDTHQYRRKYPRKDYSGDAVLVYNGRAIMSQMMQISEGGAMISADFAPTPHKPTSVHFDMNENHIRANAEVVYVLPKDETQKRKVGVRFSAISAADRIVIREYTGEVQDDSQAKAFSFILALAHDLRTPMTVTKMCAEILSRVSEKSEGKILVSRIVDSVDRMERMIENLLDAYRIRAGHALPLEFERCNLKDLVPLVLDDLSSIYGNRFVLDMSEPVEGLWSLEGLRRMIENLAVNAAKYGSKNTPITVSVISYASRVQISVHNFGNALSDEKLGSIFSPYERTDLDSLSKKGWGLGLTIVRGIAESHSGTVRVESSKENGTTFIVDLPMDPKR